MAAPFPPMTFLTVQVLTLALKGDERAAEQALLALDKPEWQTSDIVLRTPERLLITPVKFGDEWSALAKEDQP